MGITELAAHIEEFLGSVLDKSDVRTFMRVVEGVSDVAAPTSEGPIEMLVVPSAIITNDDSPIITKDATRGQQIDAAAGFRANAHRLIGEAGHAMAAAITIEQLADRLAPGRRV